MSERDLADAPIRIQRLQVTDDPPANDEPVMDGAKELRAQAARAMAQPHHAKPAQPDRPPDRPPDGPVPQGRHARRPDPVPSPPPPAAGKHRRAEG